VKKLAIDIPLGGDRVAHIAQVNNRTLGAHFDDVVLIEEASFPPSIRDSPTYLVKLAESPLELFLLATVTPDDKVVGYLAAERLELFEDVPGVRFDPHYGLGDSIYLASVAVLEPYRHKGIGTEMQASCLSLARKSNFQRVTAHVRSGALERMRLSGRVLQTFGDWYRTGEPYDYVELRLRSSPAMR
jgi:GNAT superfamily N-acetyltransferase